MLCSQPNELERSKKMKELLDKLSSYNIFNYLFPGILFCVISKTLIGYNLIIDDIVLGVFLYYFIGLTVSRMGSIVIEPVMRKTKFIIFAKYSDFITASKKDEKIELLSEVNNMYRTIISLILMISILYGFSILESHFPILIKFRWIILALFLFVLFLLSYRKQTKYIVDRVNRINEEKEVLQ